MLSNGRKISALVQCGFAGDDKYKASVSSRNRPIYQIAKSAMDDSYVDNIDYHGENVLVIIEGLTMYLCEKISERYFLLLKNHFRK